MRLPQLLLSIVAFFLFSTNSKAKVIQLLHTNDLHSYFSHFDHNPNVGGAGTLKNFISHLKDQAAMHQMPTLALDAGDFSEGQLYYMANKGRESFQTFGEIGFQAAAIGNHDYLMGSIELDNLLGEIQMPTTLLAANWQADDKYQNIKRAIRPYKIFNLDGVKVAVIGLTTNDILYKWRLDGIQITSEIDAAAHYSALLRAQGADIIIALTHMGVEKDKLLAMAVPELDMIVGGHSHTILEHPLLVAHPDKSIPIVQAGFHGEFLGRALLSFNRDHDQKGHVELLDWKLLTVEKKLWGEDPTITRQLGLMDQALYQLYGQDWLDGEILGYSTLAPIYVSDQSLVWGHVIADAMRIEAKAKMAVHTLALSGNDYPLGPITRRKIFNSNPRVFEFDRKEGHDVYSALVPGPIIASVIRAVLAFNIPLFFSGVSFEYKLDKKGHVKKVKHILIDGKPVKLFKLYRVAFSESIVRGGLSISSLSKIILRDPTRLPVSMWKAIENLVKAKKIIGPDYSDDPTITIRLGLPKISYPQFMAIPPLNPKQTH